ncbi:hypothetical protein T06_13761, partial [Trichinella sp. T6]
LLSNWKILCIPITFGIKSRNSKQQIHTTSVADFLLAYALFHRRRLLRRIRSLQSHLCFHHGDPLQNGTSIRFFRSCVSILISRSDALVHLLSPNERDPRRSLGQPESPLSLKGAAPLRLLSTVVGTTGTAGRLALDSPNRFQTFTRSGMLMAISNSLSFHAFSTGGACICGSKSEPPVYCNDKLAFRKIAMLVVPPGWLQPLECFSRLYYVPSSLFKQLIRPEQFRLSFKANVMLAIIRGSDVKTSATCVTTNGKQSSLYNHFPFPHNIK